MDELAGEIRQASGWMENVTREALSKLGDCMAKALVAATLAVIFSFGVTFWYYEGLAPEARTSFKQKLGLPVSAQEALQAEAYTRLGKFGRAFISNARVTQDGELCGQASIASNVPTVPEPRLERFILSPGNFFEFGDKGIEALGNPEWQMIARLSSLTVTLAGRPEADLHRLFLYKRWEMVCDEVLPTAETAADARDVLRSTLKDPASATFRRDQLTIKGYCGEINAKNSFGALTGFTRFYLIPDQLWQAEGSTPIFLKADGVLNTSPSTENFRSGKATPAQIQKLFDAFWKEVCED